MIELVDSKGNVSGISKLKPFDDVSTVLEPREEYATVQVWEFGKQTLYTYTLTIYISDDEGCIKTYRILLTESNPLYKTIDGKTIILFATVALAENAAKGNSTQLDR